MCYFIHYKREEEARSLNQACKIVLKSYANKEVYPMKLYHINLTATDVIAAREFLEKYFYLQTKRINSDSFAVLTDDDGLLLALMKDTQANDPKSFHIGFFQESK